MLWTGFVWLRSETVGGLYVTGNELSNFIMCRDLLDEKLLGFEGLCFREVATVAYCVTMVTHNKNCYQPSGWCESYRRRLLSLWLSVVCVKIASYHLFAVSNIAVGEMTQLGLCFELYINLTHSVQRNCHHSRQQNDTFIHVYVSLRQIQSCLCKIVLKNLTESTTWTTYIEVGI